MAPKPGPRGGTIAKQSRRFLHFHFNPWGCHILFVFCDALAVLGAWLSPGWVTEAPKFSINVPSSFIPLLVFLQLTISVWTSTTLLPIDLPLFSDIYLFIFFIYPGHLQAQLTGICKFNKDTLYSIFQVSTESTNRTSGTAPGTSPSVFSESLNAAVSMPFSCRIFIQGITPCVDVPGDSSPGFAAAQTLPPTAFSPFPGLVVFERRELQCLDRICSQ